MTTIVSRTTHAITSFTRLSFHRHFFCALHSLSTRSWPTQPASEISTPGPNSRHLQLRHVHGQNTNIRQDNETTPTTWESSLPITCPGCGALTQWIDPDQAGYFSKTRKSVKDYVRSLIQANEKPLEVATSHSVSESLETQPSDKCSDSPLEEPTPSPASSSVPVCDRCHNLINHSRGSSILHPSIDSIRRTILESPFKNNHIYHILDAADFPLSLVPGIFKKLSLAPQRSKNRRSKTYLNKHSKKPTVSFVIARSDLLAPQKEQVDSLMPYLVQVLRDALGPHGENIRLGNVHCVSAKRGWWTPRIKEDIWNRGGGNWMLGKVNVGKSNLFEVIFPRGRNQSVNYEKLQQKQRKTTTSSNDLVGCPGVKEARKSAHENVRSQEDADFHLDDTSLLPPPQPQVQYPVMPITSSLPGTTALPIRLPFGNGRGELIDLPGLARGNLEDFIKDEHKLNLVTTNRIKAEQATIKPGQSLLLGGVIRITPLDPVDMFLSYPFTPISSHVTSTEKAIGIQTQTRDSNVKSIAKDGVAPRISSAGIFELKWDVTKARSGPLTAHDAVGLKTDQLAFKIMSTDILIEGCGWVEVTTQIRKSIFRKDDGQNSRDIDAFAEYKPRVEVFTPDGESVGARKPMNAWVFTAKKPGSSQVRGRPRKSMKGAKKRAKTARVTAAA